MRKAPAPWVYGVLSQGGIPNVGLLSGGQIKYIKLEHVWVEAYVDYVPSRGAVNKTPDTWIRMDGKSPTQFLSDWFITQQQKKLVA